MFATSIAPMTILVVDDQRTSRTAIAAALGDTEHHVIEADGAERALDLFKHHHPDLVLLDVEMPVHDGYWVARQLRAVEPGSWTPILFLTGCHGDDLDLWHGIEAGADDYLIKPVSAMVLKAKLLAMGRLARMRQRLVTLSEELRCANQQLQRMSDTDALTGLLNRRGFDVRLHDDIESARRHGNPLTLLLCDLDEFKAYNDSLGHVEGDNCLRRLAQVLQGCCLRATDSASRYGGEEFALILPCTSPSGAMTFARGLLRTIELLAVPHPASRVAAHVTLSGGITTCVPDKTTTVEALVKRADEALYTAKARGRHRMFSFEMQTDAIDHLPQGTESL